MKRNKKNGKSRLTGAKILCTVVCVSLLVCAFFVLLGIRNNTRALNYPTDREYALVDPDLPDFETAFNEAFLAPGSGITSTGDNAYTVTGTQGFITLARASRNKDFAGCTFHIPSRDLIELAVTDNGTDVISESSFLGIGCDALPFRGTLSVMDVTDDTYLRLKGWSVLFNNLSNEASVVSASNSKKLQVAIDGTFSLCDTLTITADGAALDIGGFRFSQATTSTVTTDRQAGLVAARVKGGSCSVDLSAVFTPASRYVLTTSSGNAGGLFGVIEQDASVTVTMDSFHAEVTSSDGDAGILVGANYGSFTLQTVSGNGFTLSGKAVSAVGAGKASGAVGRNGEDAVLTFGDTVSADSVTVTGSDCGIAVGFNSSGAETVLTGGILVTAPSVTGNRIGGVIGYSEGKLTLGADATVGVSDGTFRAADASAILGGILGMTTVTPSGTGSYLSQNNTFAFGENGSAGGFIGVFVPDTDADFSNVSVVSATFDGVNAGTVGGYFGRVDATVSVTLACDGTAEFRFVNTKSGILGGLIGSVTGTSVAKGVTIGGGTGTLTLSNRFTQGGFTGILGGVVGSVGENAYLRVADLAVTNDTATGGSGIADVIGVGADHAFLDVADVSYTCVNTASTGGSVLVSETRAGTVLRLSGTVTDRSDKFNHIVGKQNRSLLFSDGTGFVFVRKAEPNGNDVGNYGQILRNDRLNFLRVDENHAVSLNQLAYTGGNLTLRNAADAACLAVTLQTEGLFSGVAGIGESNYTDLLGAGTTVTLADHLDLRHSGVEQFTRSDSDTAFSGTFDGNGKTLTLAVGESINMKNDPNGENVGIRNNHNERTHLGIFSAVSGATFRSLTVTGTVTYLSSVGGSARICIGGVAGSAANGLTLTDCTTEVQITLASGSASGNNCLYAGGFVGVAENASLFVTGCTITPTLAHTSGYIWGTVYLGGVAAKVTASADVLFTDNTVGTSVTATDSREDAYVGACFGILDGNKYINVDMSGTHAEGVTVRVNAKRAGGMLGYRFTNTRVIMDSSWEGTVINSYASSETVGGFLSTLSGKLTIRDGGEGKRFTLGSSVFTASGTRRGVLLGDGKQAIVTVACTPDAFRTITADGFDLFVGENISEYSSAGVAASGGIVTVETNGSEIGEIPVGSEWFTLFDAHGNSRTRYYFNIAALEGRAATGTVSSPADLIYWNVYDFMFSSLPWYVREESYPAEVLSITGATASQDMTDYCFYPTKKEGVTFAFDGRKLTFGKTLSATPAQMYGLQAGVFSDIVITSEKDTAVNFGNIVLAGSLSPVRNGSGAFVCGKITGTRNTQVTAVANVTVHDVFFDGLRVDSTASYRPLLINIIDSHVTGNISSVSQYTKASYKTVNKENTYAASGASAASSLIGRGGVESSDGTASSNINVIFREIVFAGKRSETIFTKAILVQSICYVSGTGSFIYNFNLEEDWKNGHINVVTYGKELYDNEDQREYYDQSYCVSPERANATEPYAAFGTEYLVYVIENPDKLSVNRKWESIAEGFGTYENPYIIDTAEQLLTLCKLLQGQTDFPDGWTINYPRTPDYTSYDTYVSVGGTLTLRGGTKTLNKTDLLIHLQGAYYRIRSESLSLPFGFTGIGTPEYAFHGVIFGENTDIYLSDYENIGSDGFGGFINVANGCVVFGIRLHYGTVGLSGTGFTNNTSATTRPSASLDKTLATTGTPHFGGVIGWIIGGDNLIENVGVDFANIEKGHISTVFGGYVGMISGGGVFFRNLSEYALPNASEYDNYFYYNAYVGKRLSGYAISNDRAYDNGNKNYQIPVIGTDSVKNGGQGVWSSSDRSYRLANEEQLLMLAFAMNSGALSYRNNSLAYNNISYGTKGGALSRFGDYRYVGQTGNPGGLTFSNGRYTDDTRNNGRNVFTDYFGIAANDWRNTNISLILTGTSYDLAKYGNAFLGFGSSLSGGELFNISEVRGENGVAEISVASDVKQYYNSSSNTIEQDALRNLAFVMERNAGNANFRFANIKLTGKVHMTFYDFGGNMVTRKVTNTKFCVGGLIAYASNASFDNITLENLSIRSPGWAGGLVASEEYYDNFSATSAYAVNNCKLNGVTVDGLQSTGGLFGYLRLNGSRLNPVFNDVHIQDSVIRAEVTYMEQYNDGSEYNVCVGGMIGLILKKKSTGIVVSGSSVSGSAVLCLAPVTPNNASQSSAAFLKNVATGGFFGRTTASVRFEGCVTDGCVIGACSVKTADGKFPTEYVYSPDAAGSVTVTGSRYEKISNALMYLLDKNAVGYGNAGGFIGEAEEQLVFALGKDKDGNDVRNRVISDAATTVILGYHNAAGIVQAIYCPNGTFEYSYVDILATAHPTYIIAGSGAAGLTVWSDRSGMTYTGTDVRIAGNDDHLLYIMSTGGTGSSIAGGLFGDIRNAAIDFTRVEVSSTAIVSRNAAGIINGMSGSTLSLNNVNIFGNRLQGNDGAVAGIVNTAENSVTIDGLYFGENLLRNGVGTGNTPANVGYLASNVKGEYKAYYLLFNNNDVGYCTADEVYGYAAALNLGTPAAWTTPGSHYDRVGHIAYANGGEVSVFAVSICEDSETFTGKQFVTETSGSTKAVLYAAYGAPKGYLGTFYPSDSATPQKDAINSMTYTVAGGDGSDLTLGGDPMTSAGTILTPDFLNKNLSWWDAWNSADDTVKLPSTGMSTLSDLLARIGTSVSFNQTLPVLYINGQTHKTVSELLALVTGGGSRTFIPTRAEAVRYNVGSDGKLLADSSANSRGSVLYNYDAATKTGEFTAGTYDILSEDAKTLTVLRVTFEADGRTYSVNIVVYYPQILEIRTSISAMEGEVYRLRSFLTDPANGIDISAGSMFSFLIEYAYNAAAENVENFNFDKLIYSSSRDGSTAGHVFFAGTTFLLFDLNSPEAYGYRYYTLTLTEDGLTVRLNDFTDSDGNAFASKTLQSLLANGSDLSDTLYEKVKDKDDEFVPRLTERYLVVVIPAEDDDNSYQLNLKAQVAENDKNITVHSKEDIRRVSVWGAADSSVEIKGDDTEFSNRVGKELTAEILTSEIFTEQYVAAMIGRTFYGTHEFRLIDAEQHFVTLPAGTVVRLTREDGTVLMTKNITAGGASSVRYGVDDILSEEVGKTHEYHDRFFLTFDFSGVSAQEFNTAFGAEANTYTLQDSFYLSGDAEHYTSGSKTVRTKLYTVERAMLVKATVIPEDRRHLAINFGDLTDVTNNGEIYFRFSADFSSVPDVTFSSAKVEFSIEQKQLVDGVYKYVPYTAGDVGDVTSVDSAWLADGTMTVTDGRTSGRFLLKVNMGIDKSRPEYLTNYRLVVKVTGYGTDTGGGEASHDASAYFVFLLCDIQNQRD